MIDTLMEVIENLLTESGKAWTFLTTPMNNTITTFFGIGEITPLSILSVSALSTLAIYYLIRGLAV